MASEGLEAMALFGFLAVAAVALFSFIAVASWSDNRRRERESYYHNDMLKKLAESSGAGASAALELLREDARLRALRKRQDMKVSGVVLAAVGIGMIPFLHALIRHAPIYMAGIMVLLLGIGLFGSSFFFKAPAE